MRISIVNLIGNLLTNIILFQIVAGDFNFDKDDGTEQISKVVKIIIHEKYNNHKVTNDIALLKLETPLKMNDYVQPVELPSLHQPTPGGTKCVVSGWGSLSEDGRDPSKLHRVDVPTITDEECRDKYSKSDILDSNLCCGGGGKDSCQGDSGGPLYCHGYQAGVVSWGIGCGDPKYPGVYTEVSYYIDWINKHA